MGQSRGNLQLENRTTIGTGILTYIGVVSGVNVGKYASPIKCPGSFLIVLLVFSCLPARGLEGRPPSPDSADPAAFQPGNLALEART